MKRVISAMLVLVMVLSLAPVLRMEAKAEETDIKTLVEEQIRAYADSIDQADAASEAAWVIAMHGILKGGATMYADETDALTATLINSELMQSCLINSCTEMIKIMQDLGRTKLYAHGGAEWHSGVYYCFMEAYNNEGHEDADLIRQMVQGYYYGALNSYDTSLEWLAGSTNVDYTMQRCSVTSETVTYEITLRIHDYFDFSQDTSASISADLLALFGSAMFREFSWESSATFYLTVPHSCDHADAFEETVIAPTCSSRGYTAHTCTKCGYSYNTDYVEMLPHDYRDEVIAPSCTAEGYTSHTCKTCGFGHNTDVVPMPPHSFDNYVSNNDATCAHDGTKTGKCTVCGASDTVTDEGTALPHDWMDATCTKAQTCRVCGGIEGEPLGHDLKYYNAKAPTCTDVGWDAYEKCQRCRHSTFAPIPALGHNYVDGVCLNCGDGDVLLGDLNGDGEVDIFDANLIVAYYNGTADLTAAQQKAADVNGDGDVDIFDANLVVSYYNGTIAVFPH